MENEIKKPLKKGNVVFNINKGTKGRKEVIWKDREAEEGEVVVCEKPHEDGDFSYLCGGEYCRCCS